MALYYPPPPPFVGGRQPLDARDLPASIVAVAADDPPFGIRPWLLAVLRAWEPSPPRPQGWRYATPLGIVIPSEDPPFRRQWPWPALLTYYWPADVPRQRYGWFAAFSFAPHFTRAPFVVNTDAQSAAKVLNTDAQSAAKALNTDAV